MSTNAQHKRRWRQGLGVMALSCALAAGGWQLAHAQDSADAGAPPQAGAVDQGSAEQGAAGGQERAHRGGPDWGRPGVGGGGQMRSWRDFRDFQAYREFREFQQWQRFRAFQRGHHGMRDPAMLLDRPLLGALRQLDLSQDQWQKVRMLLMTARQVRGAQPRPSPAQLQALLNPGDPGHASALQAAKEHAAERLQRAAELQQRLYEVLTPEQKTQLNQLFARAQTRLQQRSEHPRSEHPRDQAGGG